MREAARVHEGSVVPGGRVVPSLARGDVQGVGCVKAVPYKGNKKVWNNQINAGIFVPEWKILHITILHVTFTQFHLAEDGGESSM